MAVLTQHEPELAAQLALIARERDLLGCHIFGAISDHVSPNQLQLVLQEMETPSPALGKEYGPGVIPTQPSRSARALRPPGTRIPQNLPVIERVLVHDGAKAASEHLSNIDEEVRLQINFGPARFFRRRLEPPNYAGRCEVDAVPVAAFWVRPIYDAIARCDGYGVSHRFNYQRVLTQARCWAHACRGFFQSKEEEPRLAGVILRQIGKVYAIQAVRNSAIVCVFTEGCRTHGIDPCTWLRRLLSQLPGGTNWQLPKPRPQTGPRRVTRSSRRLNLVRFRHRLARLRKYKPCGALTEILGSAQEKTFHISPQIPPSLTFIDLSK